MTKKSSTLAAGLLLLSLTMGLAGAAAAEIPNETEQKVDKTMKLSLVQATPATALGGVHMTHATGFGLLANPVHEQHYLKLLVKAYSPDSEQAWNEAFEERKQVEPQLSKAITIKQIQLGDQKPLISFIHKENVVVTDVHDNRINPPLQEVTLGERQPITLAVSPQAKLQGELSKAIEADDATAIKTLLPELLENYKQATDNLLQSNNSDRANSTSDDSK